MTIEQAQTKFITDRDLCQRVSVLKLASEINPDFRNPHMTGGYLRDILLGNPSIDCDVVFKGTRRDQPGILEAVREAEVRLGLEQLSGWEFENVTATGPTGDLYEDTIGNHSNHTDFLTLLTINTHGELRVGSSLTLPYLESRTYDIRYQGLLVWSAFRNRSYFRARAGVATRGMYLCHRLKLNPTEEAEKLFRLLDDHFERLDQEERVSLMRYWQKKTHDLPNISEMLERYDILSLRKT